MGCWWVADGLHLGVDRCGHPTGLSPGLSRCMLVAATRSTSQFLCRTWWRPTIPRHWWYWCPKMKSRVTESHEKIQRCKAFETFWNKYQRSSERILSSVGAYLILRWCLKTRWDPIRGQLVRRCAKMGETCPMWTELNGFGWLPCGRLSTAWKRSCMSWETNVATWHWFKAGTALACTVAPALHGALILDEKLAWFCKSWSKCKLTRVDNPRFVVFRII